MDGHIKSLTEKKDDDELWDELGWDELVTFNDHLFKKASPPAFLPILCKLPVKFAQIGFVNNSLFVTLRQIDHLLLFPPSSHPSIVCTYTSEWMMEPMMMRFFESSHSVSSGLFVIYKGKECTYVHTHSRNNCTYVRRPRFLISLP